jgi:two-component system chemotaxis sensor kinase CheA
MTDLFGEFIADLREGFERAAPSLALWVNNPQDRAALDAVFRFAHTVRGNAGFLDLERFERLCDGAERGLAQARAGQVPVTPDFVAGVATLVERLGTLADAVEAGVGLSDADEPDMVRAIGFEPIDKRRDEKQGAAPVQRRTRTVRIPTEQFELLATSMEEVEAGQRELLELMSFVEPNSPMLPAITELSTRIASMARALTASSQQLVDRIFAGLGAIVSQTAARCGKQAELVLDGGHIMFDREVVDGLRDPLLHVVRNALSHGIEAPADRQQLGKPEAGTIHVSASLVGDHLVLAISDDGTGLDEAALRAAGQANGMIGLPIEAILQSPGISTAQEVTALSGRGVGLDAVAQRLNLLGGAVSYDSTVGQGLTVTLSAPSRRKAAHAA